MGQNTVLVVDDNEDIRESLQLLLEVEGYDIVTAGDGQEALDLISLLPNPAVILLDLQMPRLDGYGVLLDLSQHPEKRDRLSVFLLTANIGQLSPDMVRLLGMEGVSVLPKPFDIDQLKAQIHSAFVRLEEQQGKIASVAGTRSAGSPVNVGSEAC
jgi:CheY-like chemotaxis protein